MSWWQYIVRTPILFAILIYLVGIIIVVAWKPAFVWDERRKRYRHFGTGREETVYPLWMIALMMGVLCYSIATVVSWIQGRSTIDSEAKVSGPSSDEAFETIPPPDAAPVPPAAVASAPATNEEAYSSVSQRGGGGRHHSRTNLRTSPNIRVPNSQIWLNAMG